LRSHGVLDNGYSRWLRQRKYINKKICAAVNHEMEIFCFDVANSEMVRDDEAIGQPCREIDKAPWPDDGSGV
jgi:hypothetical protein